jgi:hypothetical protein
MSFGRTRQTNGQTCLGALVRPSLLVVSGPGKQHLDVVPASAQLLTPNRRFWHRLHLNTYNDFAQLLLPRSLLRNKLTRRICMTITLFFMTGLVHQLTTLEIHPRCGGDWADIKFFLANAFAVLFESAVLQLVSYHRNPTTHQKQLNKTANNRRWTTIVQTAGYLWVVTFFVWLVPKCYYGRLRCESGQAT